MLKFINKFGTEKFLDLDDALGHGLARVVITETEVVGIGPGGDDDEIPLAEWDAQSQSWILDRDLDGFDLFEGTAWASIRETA